MEGLLLLRLIRKRRGKLKRVEVKGKVLCGCGFWEGMVGDVGLRFEIVVVVLRSRSR